MVALEIATDFPPIGKFCDTIQSEEDLLNAIFEAKEDIAVDLVYFV